MALGADLRQEGASTESARGPGAHRRSLGLPWLLGLVLIPMSIAAIGYGAQERLPSASGPTGALPTLAPSARPGAPALSLAPLSIARNGNAFTLSGDFPDESAKAALLKALNGSLPRGINVIDQIHINPSVDALDFANAAQIFKDSGSIADFNLTVSGDTITLAGTATSPDQKDIVNKDATKTWSNLNVLDDLAVSGPAPPPPPPPPPPPAAPAAATCADLQAAVNAATGGPLTFGNDGFSLTPADEQILGQIADKLKACPNAHATINGYTDNSGTEAINVPLSAQRGQTVADFLVGHGVPAAQLIVKGLGSVNPVAPNETAEGRAKNRRVEIVAS